MGLHYQAVQWNRQKRLYDLALASGVGLYLALFIILNKTLFPYLTDEILLIRAFGSAAFILLHVVLCIGPLCRLHPAFLPLLYNRRHAGVTLCLLGLVHAILVVATYHAGGNTNPILGIFTSTRFQGTVGTMPFQAFGFVALFILLLMAATSHDFWLANLTAPIWKTLHMLVYLAYALLVLHVAFGILQAETHPGYVFLVAAGLVTVLGLHLAAARREKPLDQPRESDADAGGDGYVDVCAVDDIREKRARLVCLGGERVAVFKYDGRISAVSNVCQHQNGPLGEGRIVDGCITCPWHGYQYEPESGASPAPFTEKVPTFRTRVKRGRVLVHPAPLPAGTPVTPARIGEPSPVGSPSPQGRGQGVRADLPRFGYTSDHHDETHV